MPATKNYPRDTAGGPYELGLVLQSKGEVDCNEFGLQQATLRFATYNRNLKKFRAARGAFLRAMKLGDDPTRAALRDLDFLGVQSSKMIRNGKCPGKGILEIMAQGAIFDGDAKALGALAPASSNDPITVPWNPSTQTKQEVQFHTYKPSTTVTNPPSYVPVLDVTLDYYSVDLYFEYMARDRAPAPRFLQENYTPDDVGLIVVSALNDQLFRLQVDRASAWQTNISIQNGQIQIIPGVGVPVQVDQSIWSPWVKYVGTNTQFKQTQAGPFWHVLEQNSIHIEPLIPQGNIVSG